MNHFDLDRRLKAESNNQEEMSAKVRRRLDDTYASLLENTVEEPSVAQSGTRWKPVGRQVGPHEERPSTHKEADGMYAGKLYKPAGTQVITQMEPAATQAGTRQAAAPVRLWKRRSFRSAAAVAVLGAAIFGSGFVSPAMADSIRQIPLIGSLFSSLELDLGLRNAGENGLTTAVDEAAAFDQTTLRVQETIYDGSRAVLAFTVDAPWLKEGIYHYGKKEVKLSDAIEDIRFISGASSQLQGVGQYWGAGEAHPNSIIFEQSVGEAEAPLPDRFEATLEVKLAGIDKPFVVTVPFVRNTNDVVDLTPGAVQTVESLRFTVDRVTVTPITTTLQYSLEQLSGEPLDEAAQNELIYTNVAVYDDKGNLLHRLSGEGVFAGKKLQMNVSYASASGGLPAKLILKPFKNNDGEIPKKIDPRAFIPGLEHVIELPGR